jgi:hypothetical protein
MSPGAPPDASAAKAKPWKEVAASKAYQALSPDEQKAARIQYFRDVVAPRVATEDLRAAFDQFDAATRPPSMTETAVKAVKGAAVDAGNVVAGVATGAYQWARDGIMGKTPESVMDGPGADAAIEAQRNAPGRVAPMSRQGDSMAAWAARGLGAAGVDQLRGQPGVMARGIVAAADSPAAMGEVAAVESAMTPEAPPPQPKPGPSARSTSAWPSTARITPCWGSTRSASASAGTWRTASTGALRCRWPSPASFSLRCRTGWRASEIKQWRTPACTSRPRWRAERRSWAAG